MTDSPIVMFTDLELKAPLMSSSFGKKNTRGCFRNLILKKTWRERGKSEWKDFSRKLMK